MKIYEKPSMMVELLMAEETIADDKSNLGGIDPLGDTGNEISIPAPDGEYWQ